MALNKHATIYLGLLCIGQSCNNVYRCSRKHSLRGLSRYLLYFLKPCIPVKQQQKQQQQQQLPTVKWLKIKLITDGNQCTQSSSKWLKRTAMAADSNYRETGLTGKVPKP